VHLELSQQLLASGPLDLLVWPETVYPTTFGAPKSEEGAAFDREIAAVSVQTGMPLVFGAFETSEAGEHNAAFFLDASERPVAVDSYRKSILFPMTEHVPKWLDSRWLRDALPWTGHWEPGPGPKAVGVRLRDRTIVLLAPLICYEALHPGYVAAAVRSGASAILTLSNDAWFPNDAAPRLHLLSAAFRSIELRVPQIRVTNSGISALVLPTGAVVAATRFGERAAVRFEVPRMRRTWTLVLAWGDWLGPTALTLTALLLGGRRILLPIIGR
jgi:apolipoprotein N-acyltransferase